MSVSTLPYRNKYIWNDVKIEVPSKFIAFNKKNQIIEKSPLTAKKNISKMNKKPSIQIIDSPDDKVHVVSQTIDEKKKNIQNEMKKVIAKKIASKILKKNKQKKIDEYIK